VESSGPAHAPQFIIEVTITGYAPERAKAATKRGAEQVSAGLLLERLEAMPS
jgi:dsRNA-specific ribonuclease